MLGKSIKYYPKWWWKIWISVVESEKKSPSKQIQAQLLKIGLNAPKGNDRIPTIHFKVPCVNSWGNLTWEFLNWLKVSNWPAIFSGDLLVLGRCTVANKLSKDKTAQSDQQNFYSPHSRTSGFFSALEKKHLHLPLASCQGRSSSLLHMPFQVPRGDCSAWPSPFHSKLIIPICPQHWKAKELQLARDPSSDVEIQVLTFLERIGTEFFLCEPNPEYWHLQMQVCYMRMSQKVVGNGFCKGF